MKPIFQSHKHNDPKCVGDCLRACVASIFEKDLEEVPHFLDDGTGGFDEWWFHRLATWLAPLGFEPVMVDAANCRNPDRITTAFYGRGYHIATGVSPRSLMSDGHLFNHSCVYREGQLAHDPFPGGNGIEAGLFAHFICFAALDPAREVCT